MITLRMTQSLLKDMKAKPDEQAADGLYSWHANIIKLNNRKQILLVNDETLLCLFLEGIRAGQLDKLQSAFVQTLREYLLQQKLEERAVSLYLEEATTFSIAKTNSRSVIGTMTEISFFQRDDFAHPLDRIGYHNRIIRKPLNYDRPIEAFQKALWLNMKARAGG
ncbi:DUF6933 domain-containing protein [Paenibacillus pasadenensis]|uniref:DUF6933 domain-containing protein n=1 Tax=Paenibacillus pasadenensis TaxID=217090 RepID=A0A2N5N9X5_9BACL|nr:MULTISPECIES: hypothetical protein [Paenibacillus]PLT47139.1 hypothetical protein B8V81_1363 [Paenibacillus pasadenensis]QGG57467.1 hypothetical protein GE073_18935 [Paenibacillus sp. B01]